LADILLNLEFKKLFRMLFLLTPPLSAFIDFIVVTIQKKYINSAEQFLYYLFKEREITERDSLNDAEQQIHDPSTEKIRGQEMKTLYEKFCYLNGYLEKKLDDTDNVNLLLKKGY